MERQTSSEKVSTPSKAPLLGTAPTGTFQLSGAIKNPFQLNNQEGVGSSSDKATAPSSLSTDSVAGTGLVSDQRGPSGPPRSNPFSKKIVADEPEKVAASLFGKALQKTTETIGKNSGPAASSSETAFGNRTANLFGKPPETMQRPVEHSSGGLFSGTDTFAKDSASSNIFFKATASPVFKLGGLFGNAEKQKQDENQSKTAAEENKGIFGSFPGRGETQLSAPPSDKQVPAGSSTTTSSSTPAFLFGKPVTTGSGDSAEPPAAKLNLLTKPSMLFGKPVVEDTAQKSTSAPTEADDVSKEKNPAENASPFGQAFKPRPNPFGATLPPFSSMRWTADGNNKLSTQRPAQHPAPKQDAPRPRGNLVWTKEKAIVPPPRPPPESMKKGPDTIPTIVGGQIDQREAAGASAPLRQLNVVTRSHTRSASPSKFAELFVHAAHSVGDRHKLLDAKDKILREQISSEPQKGPIKGTCADMCPEKERYHRSLRNLVEKFEMLPGADGVMDHTRMVKEYQRSSADQELPLPHELRPPPILEMTMNYLISEIIANQPAKSPGDWFTFIWNRTRAIRKDITQQKIEADPTSAVILERCARFHIHCGHSLCEEDHHYFDPKLNNENLTKCLKSLKYSYADLKVQKIRCPNEAEFVAYEILLNLKEGDIAKMITDLEPEIRKQPLVRLAISAMNALTSGNYRRFFNVVRQAPYLAACILHRYFTEVRRHALRVLAKSLSSKGADVSVSALAKDLCFNGDGECATFLAVLNIESDENGFINLKTIHDYDDARFEMRKCQHIEQQMGQSLAQVVYGPGMIPLINYSPVDSFTADGMLRKSALGLPEDFKIGEVSQSVAHPTPPVEPRKRRELTEEDLQPALMAIMDRVLQEQVNTVSRGAAEEQAMSVANLNRIIENVIVEEAQEVAKETYEQEHKADQLRRRALLSKLAHDLSGELVLKHSSSFLKELCEEALTEIRLDVVAELATEVQNELLASVLDDLVADTINVEHASILGEYHRHLASTFRTTMLCRRVLKKWRRWCLLQKEIRDFPAGPNLGAQRRYPNTGKSYAEMKAERSRLSQMRILAGFSDLVDTVPLNIAGIFGKRVRILVVGDVSKVIMNKLKKLLSSDHTVNYLVEPPETLQGFNVVICAALAETAATVIASLTASARTLTPEPVIGILWCGPRPSVAFDVEEELLLGRANQPLSIPLRNLLKKLAKNLPDEVRLQRASLPEFVNRSVEFCLDKVPAPCNYLPAVVKLYNEIIEHIAAVATSARLLHVNALDEETNWNSTEYFSKLYGHIRSLQFPVPTSSDRGAFVESVQRAKNVNLLTTAVNMVDFKDDFVLLRDIHSRLNYTLDPHLIVRYLDEDLRKFQVPDFWYQRPLEVATTSAATTPAAVSPSAESDAGDDQKEEENFTERIDAVIRSARELLRRSGSSGRRRGVLLSSDEHNMKRSPSYPELLVENSRKRRSDGSRQEQSAVATSFGCTNNIKDYSERVSPGRLSKRTKTELDVLELQRTIATYKHRLRINKLLEDA